MQCLDLGQVRNHYALTEYSVLDINSRLSHNIWANYELEACNLNAKVFNKNLCAAIR